MEELCTRTVIRLYRPVLALWLCLAPATVRADYTANVNPGSVLAANFQGWGSSLCWWANVTGGYPNRTNFVDLAFNQLKLNIVRYNIGGGQNPANTATPGQGYRAMMQGFEPSPGVWNWNADANQRWVLQYALAHGVNLVDAFANSPPWWMCVNSNCYGNASATNNLQVNNETNFAVYLATVVSNLTVLDGDHFNYLTPMNEPNGSKWTGASQEGCDMNPAQESTVVAILRTQLNTIAPAVQIDAAEDVDPYQTYNDLVNYSSGSRGDVALLTTHTYSATGATDLQGEAASLGKPLWVAESGDGDGTGLTMAQRIHDDITVMGARAWVYWQVLDSAGGWGFLQNSLVGAGQSGYTTNYTINEKFYAMGQFSEFVRPGCNIISVNDASTLAAWNPTNASLVLVLANTNASSLNVTYNLSGFGSLSWHAAVYQTASGKNLALLSAPVVTNQDFTEAIPAKSITTFVLTTNVAPPTLLSQTPPANASTISLYAGQTPAFSVSAAGGVPLHYQWWSNHVAVAGATNTGYAPAGLPTGSLTPFFCSISNLAGSITSAVWSVSVVLNPTAPYPRAALLLNPIGYWRLNEGPDNGSGNQGVTCHDYVAGNNGIYSNVVLALPGYGAVTDPAETAAQFGPVLANNSYAGQINGWDFTTPAGSNAEFSVAAWVNGSGQVQNVNAGLVTKGYFYGEEMDLDEGAPGGDFRFEVRSAAGTGYNANSSINAYTNSGWHHLVGVCDEVNGQVSLYVDGTLAGSTAIPALSGITNSATVPLTIGARAANAASGENQQFFGLINDVAIYNRALSSNQVQSLYQAGISLPPVGLTITNLGGLAAELNWSYGTLQSATSAAGPYGDLTNAVQPCVIPATNPQQFYRIREN